MSEIFIFSAGDERVVLADDSCLEVVTFATCQRMYYTWRTRKKVQWQQNSSLGCLIFLLLFNGTFTSIFFWLFFPLMLLFRWNLQCIFRYHSVMPFELSCLLYFSISKGLLFISLFHRWKHIPSLFFFVSFLQIKCWPQKYMHELLFFFLKSNMVYNRETSITSATL